MMLTSRFRAATRSRSPPPRPLLRKGTAGMIRFALERVPGRRRREFEIADIGAETNSNPGADRNHDDIVHCQRRHTQAADEVGGAVDAGETLVDRVGGRQVVDQHHRARAFAAEVEAERRPLPKDPEVAGVLGVEDAFAVTQPGDHGAAGFLPQDVTVGEANWLPAFSTICASPREMVPKKRWPASTISFDEYCGP